MSEELLVFLGDVEASRRIEDRDEFQRRLEGVCEQLNRDYRADLRAEFTILKGIDEIGAVLLSVSHVYDMIDFVERGLYPERMRVAVVGGEVNTGLRGKEVGRMDGPAFHDAAAVMSKLKDTKLPFWMVVDDRVIDDALGGAASMIVMAKARRSRRQWEAVREYERLGSQALAAAELNVSQQAISHALVTADYRKIRWVEERLRRAFEDYARRILEAEGRDVVAD